LRRTEAIETLLEAAREDIPTRTQLEDGFSNASASHKEYRWINTHVTKTRLKLIRNKTRSYGTHVQYICMHEK